jgi:hypothetical protein
MLLEPILNTRREFRIAIQGFNIGEEPFSNKEALSYFGKYPRSITKPAHENSLISQVRDRLFSSQGVKEIKTRSSGSGSTLFEALIGLPTRIRV